MCRTATSYATSTAATSLEKEIERISIWSGMTRIDHASKSDQNDPVFIEDKRLRKSLTSIFHFSLKSYTHATVPCPRRTFRIYRNAAKEGQSKPCLPFDAESRQKAARKPSKQHRSDVSSAATSLPFPPSLLLPLSACKLLPLSTIDRICMHVITANEQKSKR